VVLDPYGLLIKLNINLRAAASFGAYSGSWGNASHTIVLQVDVDSMVEFEQSRYILFVTILYNGLHEIKE